LAQVRCRALDFEQAYDEHLQRVYAFFAYRVGSRTDAEDLTQQTFERALRAWERFDPRRASLATWLLVIARNLLIDHFRAARPEVGLEGVAEGAASGGELELGLDPELAAALSELGDREREIIALRFGGDLAGPEIASLTGLSLANVQQILSRSLRRLRARLEEGRRRDVHSRGVEPELRRD
jgi:RNA polymerase sigma factor (sigma-70 family)